MRLEDAFAELWDGKLLPASFGLRAASRRDVLGREPPFGQILGGERLEARVVSLDGDDRAIVFAVLLGGVAALYATLRVTRLSPAEAIRRGT